jgi:cytochrome c553
MPKSHHSERSAAWAAVLAAALSIPAPATASDGEAFFEREVRPLLAARCLGCHGGDKAGGGLSLDSRAGWEAGGEQGPAVVPGEPDASLLVRAVSGADPDWRMPPPDHGPALAPAEVAVLSEWIRRGAPDPRVRGAAIGGMDRDEAAAWWAFQPLPEATRLPTPDEIDALLGAALAERGIEPAGPADDRTFIRRATYDLTGLPPSSEEVEAFVADGAADKDARLVERLLASPDQGVHQGRRWLDVVRYADTAGENTDRPLPHAWRYRNWVFDAFTADLPYPDFVRLQLAGDLIPAAARSGRNDGIVATGYMAIARRFGHDIDKDIHLTHEDVIDTLGKTFLGLSIGCARCHDHKYDAISAHDYYALAGIFASTRFAFPGCEPKGQPRDLVPLEPEPDLAAARAAWQERVALRDAERARRDAVASRATLGEAAREDARVLAAGTVAEGESVALAAAGPIDVALGAGQVVVLAVAAGGNHGADSTLVELSIRAGDGADVWSTADVVPRLASVNPLVHGGATWCFLERSAEGPAFLGERRDEIDGKPALKAWRSGDLPSVFANTAAEPVTVWTTLPAAALFVHPGPDREALLAWICPRDGSYRIEGRVADAHPAGLDGVSFTLSVAGGRGYGALLAEAGQLTATPLADPGPEPILPVAYAVVEGTVHDAPLHQRGDPEKTGPAVPRRWLEVFGGSVVPGDGGSGRRALAEWVATSPLASRVIVNRVWQWHFGTGIVATANDFGARGTPPTHPDLLDRLAAGFVAEGGRVKSLHRAIMATRAYRRASTVGLHLLEADPGARLLSHFPRRRLTAEEIRDSLLLAAGELDRAPAEAHPFPPEATWNFTQHGPFAAVYETTERSAYLMVQRQRRHPFLALFDGADPNASTPSRQTTTVPTQALYFLNDPFFHHRAEAFARRLAALADPAARIGAGYRIAYQRPPTALEADRAAGFLAAYPGDDKQRLAAWARVLLACNEFLHVD